jgi:DNA-3-methyladenine glycosylase
MQKFLKKDFFLRNTKQVAKELLGKFLVRKYKNKLIEDMITEVEVYDGIQDRASHAFKEKGITKRNKVMYKEGGCFYVYLTYGMHWMLNIVTREKNYPAAILIRSTLNVKGPGKLTNFFKIDGKFNGKKVDPRTKLFIEDRGVRIPKNKIKSRPRIGVDYAGKDKFKKLNFYIEGEESAKRRKN